MKNKAKYLSYWDEDLDIETFKKWCGDPNAWHKQEIRRFIINRNYKSVLDVGVGLCSEYYGFIQDNYDIEYTAVEITEKYIEHGKAKGINIHLATATDLPFENESFDVTLCLAVLNHQLDYKKEIKEMLRVTKKMVLISFFKPFEEHVSESELANFESYKTPIGTVLNRMVKNGETTCIYTFFNKKKLDAFLDTLDIKQYSYFMASDKTVLLFLEKI